MLGLINFSSSSIYTTAPPFHMFAAIKCSYDLFPKLNEERLHLAHLIRFFRNNISSASWTQIQPLSILGNEAVKRASLHLREHGIDARPLLSPTVRRGNECLRICLHGYNTTSEVEILLKLINQYGF